MGIEPLDSQGEPWAHVSFHGSSMASFAMSAAIPELGLSLQSSSPCPLNELLPKNPVQR